MYQNRKTMWTIALASLVALTGLLHADDAQMRNLENRVSTLEQKRNANGMINPNGRPAVKDGSGLFATGEALLWKAQENGLDSVVRNENNSSSMTDGEFKRPHARWDWGFKVGVGYDMPHDGWDLYLNWTRFYTAAHKTVNDQNGTLFPIFASTTLPAPNQPPLEAPYTPSAVASHWNLHLNMIDLELGREFFTSKYLTMRPFVGVRNVFISQRMKVKNFDLDIGNTNHVELREKLGNDFWGIGPRAGLNTQWGLGMGLSLFGDIGLSLLGGNFDTHLRETSKSPGEDHAHNRMNVDRDFRAVRAVTDLALGLRYDAMFDEDTYHLGLQLGWEDHIFFGQNQFVRIAQRNVAQSYSSNFGDLTLQGVTLGARLDF